MDEYKKFWLEFLILILAVAGVVYFMLGFVNNHTSEIEKREKYLKISDLKQISENQYRSNSYDLQITVPDGYRYFVDKDNSIFIGNEGETITIKALSTSFNQFENDEIERYCNIFNEVEKFNANIGGRDYRGIAGYQLSKGLDTFEHKVLYRGNKKGKKVISIEAHLYGYNYSMLGTILSHDGVNDYEILSEENIKSLEIAETKSNTKTDEYYKDLERERVELGIFDKGSWDKNVYTNDLLDLRITIPAYWGYSTSLDNYFDITSRDLTESITIRVLNNTATDEMEREINRLKNDNLDQVFETFSCKIGKDEYIGFTYVGSSDRQHTFFYRNVTYGGYLISIDAFMRDETLSKLGEIFSNNNESSIKFYNKDTRTYARKIWSSEAWQRGEIKDNTYNNDYLGIKITCPKDWVRFNMNTNTISMSKTGVSGTVHDSIHFELFNDSLTYGTIENEIKHLKGRMPQYGYIGTEEKEMIQGFDVSTVSFKHPDSSSLLKYYYFPIFDGEYILEVIIDCDLEIMNEIDINELIKFNKK